MTEAEVERIVVRLVGDPKQFVDAMEKAAKKAEDTGRSLETLAAQFRGVQGELSGVGGGLVSQLTAMAGATSLLGAAWKGVGLAADAEETRVSFGVMLESMERGANLTKDLQRFAAATPLNQSEIQHATKTLLQFGTSANDIIPTLRRLGDVTGGNAQRFSQMALAFGQMSATGRLMGQDLLQMINAGFNPLKEISRTTGKSMAELKDEMEKGRISLDMIKEAFRTATEPGGQFAGLMEKQSKTLRGLFSTMGDDADAFFRTFGEGVAESARLKDAMQLVSKAFQSLTEFVKENDTEFQLFLKTAGAVITALGAAGGAGGTIAAAAFAIDTLSTSVTKLGKALIALSTNKAFIVLFVGGMAAKLGRDLYQDTVGDILDEARRKQLDQAAAIGEGGVARVGARRVQQIMEVEDPAAKRLMAKDWLEYLDKEIKQFEGAAAEARKAFAGGDVRAGRSLTIMDAALAELNRQKGVAQDLAKDPIENAQMEKMIKHMREEESLLGKTGAAKAYQQALNAGMSEQDAKRVLDQAVQLELVRDTIKAKQAELALVKDISLAEDEAFLAVGPHVKKVLASMKDVTPATRHLFDEALRAAREADANEEARKAQKELEQHDPFVKFRDALDKADELKRKAPELTAAFKNMQTEAANSLASAAESLVKSAARPREVARDVLGRLADEFKRNKLPAEVYRKTLAGIANELNEVAKKGMDAQEAVGKFDAASALSVEGWARAEEFARERARTDRGIGKAELERLANPRLTDKEKEETNTLLQQIRNVLFDISKKPGAGDAKLNNP